MGNLLIETETCEPAPGEVHAQLLDKLALAADSVQIANQQMRNKSSGSMDGRPVSL
jgi:hypothetical protein